MDFTGYAVDSHLKLILDFCGLVILIIWILTDKKVSFSISFHVQWLGDRHGDGSLKLLFGDQ